MKYAHGAPRHQGIVSNGFRLKRMFNVFEKASTWLRFTETRQQLHFPPHPPPVVIDLNNICAPLWGRVTPFATVQRRSRGFDSAQLFPERWFFIFVLAARAHVDEWNPIGSIISLFFPLHSLLCLFSFIYFTHGSCSSSTFFGKPTRTATARIFSSLWQMNRQIREKPQTSAQGRRRGRKWGNCQTEFLLLDENFSPPRFRRVTHRWRRLIMLRRCSENFMFRWS